MYWTTRFLLGLTFLISSGALVRAESSAAPSELGRPLFRYFTARDYHGDSSINAATQDNQGRMFFGNQDCVLEFDGQTWNTIPVNGAAFIRGLQCDANGTIWVGGVNQVGKLVFANGGFSFKSFGSIPGAHLETGPVWQAFSFGKTYFFTDQGLYTPAGDHLELTPWPIQSDNFWRISTVGDRLFAHAQGKPLFELVGSGFREVAPADN